MYIAGTRLDRLSGIRDVLDDVTFVPLREANNTMRYQQALAALRKSKGRVKYLVGHSLGGAAAAATTERFPELESRVYGAPLMRSSGSVRSKASGTRTIPSQRWTVVQSSPKRQDATPHTYKGY